MRSDIVPVLTEGTLGDHVEECAALFSRSLPEAERTGFIQSLQSEAVKAEATEDADAGAEQARAVVNKLVHAVPAGLDGTDREVEGVFNMLISLLNRHYDGAEADRSALFMHLVQVVGSTSTGAERSVVRYRVLANVFNALPPKSAMRLNVFNALLELAAMNGDLDFLSAAVQSLPTWLAQWEVPPEAKHECLGRVADALESSERGVEYVATAYQLELLHLRYVSNEQSLSRETRHASAEASIAAVLRLPKIFEYGEMLHVPLVSELDGTPIHALLKIFVGGRRADLEQWLASGDGRATVERHSLNPDELISKMRLLDLAELCVGSVSSEVSYDEIARVLNIPDEAVESWVIDVIRAGLVSGKLSQVKRSFRVYRSTYRSFERPQWESLEKRLVQWQSSVENLVSIIRNSAAVRTPAAVSSAADAPTSGAAPAPSAS